MAAITIAPQARNLQLTRRGKVVLASLAITVSAVMVAPVVGHLEASGAGLAPGHVGADTTLAAVRAGGPGAAIMSPAPTPTVVVTAGDTLWGIARRNFPASDPRAVIEEIRTVNHMTSNMIHPGQVLALPVP